jgi:hypothetical protein
LILMLKNEKGKSRLEIYNQILDFIYETNDLEMYERTISSVYALRTNKSKARK